MRVGLAGDRKANPREVGYGLAEHLSADLHLFLNDPAAPLSGTLFIELPGLDSAAHGATVISRRSRREHPVRDLSQFHLVEVPFGVDDEVVVILGDGNWAVPNRQYFSKFNAWVEGCGGEPSGTTIEVDSVAALIAALHAAGGGETIRLAPGRYVLSARTWSDPFQLPAALVIPADVTVAGSGDATTLVLSGQNTWIYPREGSVVRDLAVSAFDSPGFFVGGALETEHFELCNVNAQFSWSPGFGFATGFRFEVPFGRQLRVDIFGSTISCGMCQGISTIGLDAYTSGSGTGDIRIRDSEIRGWDSGLEYGNDFEADFDCRDFVGNTVNVQQVMGTTVVSHCQSQ